MYKCGGEDGKARPMLAVFIAGKDFCRDFEYLFGDRSGFPHKIRDPRGFIHRFETTGL